MYLVNKGFKVDAKIISWIGTITGLFGALLVALGIFFIGYLLFIISSLCWISFGSSIKNNALCTLNIGFLLINIIGYINLGLN